MTEGLLKGSGDIVGRLRTSKVDFGWPNQLPLEALKIL